MLELFEKEEHTKDKEGKDHPKLFLLAGCAGTGKTELFKAIEKRLKRIGVLGFNTSFNNMNVIPTSGGDNCQHAFPQF